MPPASGNGKFALLERRHRVAGLYLQGQSQWQIARALDVGQATVSRDLQALGNDWRAANAYQIDQLKDRELAKIDLIEVEAWLAWEKSKTNKERTAKERSSGESSTNSKVVVTVEGRLPDPEFLKTVQWCITKRCEILGLDAATRIHHQISATMSEADKAALIGGIMARLGAMEDDRLHEDDAGPPAGNLGRGPELGPGGAAPDPDGDGDRD